MKYILLTMMCLLLLVGCFSSSEDILTHEEYFELCPYELKYGRSHVLEVPISVTPHQTVYRVGDTLTISMHFSDSILDLSRETYFKIENFPFEPVTLLYRINGDSTWDSGYLLNQVLVEDKFNPRFNPQSNKAADMRGFTIYEEGYYHFEYKVVLETPGRYSTLITDMYEQNIVLDPERNAVADAIEFEGRCPQSNFAVAMIIDKEQKYEDYLEELIFLDKEIYWDGLTTLDPSLSDALEKGQGFFEWWGMYFFEVVE